MNTYDFKAWIGIKPVEKQPGLYRAELPLISHHKNSLGWINGGVYMTLLDTVMGNAVSSPSGTNQWDWGATLDISIQFRRPAPTDGKTGIGLVVKVGKQLVFVEGAVLDNNGTVLSRGHGTWFVLKGTPSA